MNDHYHAYRQTRDIEREWRFHMLRAPLLPAGVGLFFWHGVSWVEDLEV
jgi:hypothetical protein